MITDHQKQTLLHLARNTIKKQLSQDFSPVATDDAFFQQKSGLFVTLQKNGQLRGCIGSLTAQESIALGVQRHALNASFHDSRFRPVTVEELTEIDIEISILTEPEPLQFADAEDLLHKLRPHHDGVTLHYGNHSATFLPQVWEQLPEPAQFLNHLALKAGLGGNQWREAGVQIDIYSVIKF